MIQVVTFSSPNVGGHLTIEKGSLNNPPKKRHKLSILIPAMALAMSKRLLPFVFFAAVLWSFHLPFTAPSGPSGRGPRGRTNHPRVKRWASEGEKEEEEDWREFRARLVQQEAWFAKKNLGNFYEVPSLKLTATSST